MSEHTKGPWRACHNGECICKTVMAQDQPVAVITAGDWGDEPDFPYGTVPEDEARANARLIAAAPEMYDEMNRAFLQPARAQELMRQNDLKIDDLDDPMQKLAFTFYSMLVEAAHRAETIIESVQGEQP